MSAAPTVVRYRTDEGCFVGLAVAARTRVHLVRFGSPIRVESLPLLEQRFMTALSYPPKKAARKFRAAGRRLGITKGARRLLSRAAG